MRTKLICLERADTDGTQIQKTTDWLKLKCVALAADVHHYNLMDWM